MSVGDNIRFLREEKGMSQAWLAERAGITQAMLCQVERGTKNPSLQVAAGIAATLGCELERLLAPGPPGAGRGEKTPGAGIGQTASKIG